MSGAMLLGGRIPDPEKALDCGFKFPNPNAEEVWANLLGIYLATPRKPT